MATITKPQLEIYQKLTEYTDSMYERMAACIVGCSYVVVNNDSNSDSIPTATYTASGTDIPLVYTKNPLMTYTLDEASVRVYAEDALASIYVTEVDSYASSRPQSIRFAETVYNENNSTECHVSVGDAVVFKDSEGAYDMSTKCYVSGLLGKMGEGYATLEEKASTSVTAELSTDSAYTAYSDTTYTISVVVAGSDTSKTYTAVVVDNGNVDVATADVTLDITDDDTTLTVGSYGISVELDNLTSLSTFTEGTYPVAVVTATAGTESTTEFDGVTLSAITYDTDAIEEGTTITFCKEFTGELSSDCFTIADEVVTLNPNLYVDLNEGDMVDSSSTDASPFIDGTGTLTVTFRSLVAPLTADTVVTITSTDDIENYFGTIDPDNDLAYGCKCALSGSQGRAIYAIRATDPSADAFNTAVYKTESMNEVYSFVALSDDSDVIDKVKEFVSYCSEPAMLRWRRLLVGVENPGDMTLTSTDSEGATLTAKFSKYDGVAGYGFVQIKNSVFDLENVGTTFGTVTSVTAGDVIKLTELGTEYTVASVVGDHALILTEGPETAVALAEVSIYRPESAAATTEFVCAYARKFSDRRVSCVWADMSASDEATSGTSCKYLACELAGLSSSVEPQQSITRTEVSTVSSLPRMYTLYRNEDLDAIASEGVLIITQDYQDTACYIRHQLTTSVDLGAMYYEESYTRNLDNMSYAIADVLEGYIGKVNVTPTALRAINSDVIRVLTTYMNNATSALVGPALLEYKELSVIQDPTLMDRVIVSVELGLPSPLNYIRYESLAYIATVTI